MNECLDVCPREGQTAHCDHNAMYTIKRVRTSAVEDRESGQAMGGQQRPLGKGGQAVMLPRVVQAGLHPLPFSCLPSSPSLP